MTRSWPSLRPTSATFSSRQRTTLAATASGQECTERPVAMSQYLDVPSRDEVKRWRDEAMLTPVTVAVWPSKSLIIRPVAQSHILQPLSAPAVTMVFPGDSQTTLQILPTCATRRGEMAMPRRDSLITQLPSTAAITTLVWSGVAAMLVNPPIWRICGNTLVTSPASLMVEGEGVLKSWGSSHMSPKRSDRPSTRTLSSTSDTSPR
mmetsp:Transcript_1884/g.3799  ORF Transcript_1884/g.3799 Transcript_1884/m.3799 type:complete len:206 (-) Transcript_1884:17-634(-)